MSHTLKGIGPGGWDNRKCYGSGLPEYDWSQRLRRTPEKPQSVLYRLYTEDIESVDLGPLVSRYFAGASAFRGKGLWFGQVENSVVIEVLGVAADLQDIVHLAGDIKTLNNQQSVLVTWSLVSRLDV